MDLKEIELAGFPAFYAQAEGERRPPPIVILHGLWGTHLLMEPYLRYFAAAGFDCYAPSRRGRLGLPPERARGVAFADYVDDTLRVIDTFDQDPIVIGWSLGGLVAQKVAEAGRCRAAVFVAPVAPAGIHFLPRLGAVPTYLRHGIGIMLGRSFHLSYGNASGLLLNGVDEDERRRLFESLVPDSGRVARDFTFAGVAVDESKVNCPVFCLAGSDDNAAPAKSVRRVAAKYGAELREYPGRGHWLHEQTGWEDLAGDILAWLEANVLASAKSEQPAATS